VGFPQREQNTAPSLIWSPQSAQKIAAPIWGYLAKMSSSATCRVGPPTSQTASGKLAAGKKYIWSAPSAGIDASWEMSLKSKVSTAAATDPSGQIASLTAALHVLEMYRRNVPDHAVRRLLDRLANRILKILAQTTKLNPPEK